MRQRANIPAFTRHFAQRVALVLAVLLALGGCDRPAPTAPATVPATGSAKSPTVASMMPAATDLIIGMGAADHLVAASYQDADRPELRGIPRVGDYLNIDWEQLAVLRPRILITFMSPGRIPEGLHQRADQLNAKLVNMQIERIDHIFAGITQLGDLLQEQAKAAQAAQSLQAQLNAVRQRVAGKPRPRVLLVREKTLDGTVGTGTFLDDALQIAGGDNATRASGWPNIDREALISLKPDVILHLLPGASPQVVQSARESWAEVKRTSPMPGTRIHILTDWWILQPGMHIGKTAGKMADLIHAPSTPD